MPWEATGVSSWHITLCCHTKVLAVAFDAVQDEKPDVSRSTSGAACYLTWWGDLAGTV